MLSLRKEGRIVNVTYENASENLLLMLDNNQVMRYDFKNEKLDSIGEAPQKVKQSVDVPDVKRGMRDRFDGGIAVYEKMNQRAEFEIYEPVMLQDQAVSSNQCTLVY